MKNYLSKIINFTNSIADLLKITREVCKFIMVLHFSYIKKKKTQGVFFWREVGFISCMKLPLKPARMMITQRPNL